jgi:hypothetical protein
MVKAKNVPLGEKTPVKSSILWPISKIKHRGIQNTYATVCLRKKMVNTKNVPLGETNQGDKLGNKRIA